MARRLLVVYPAKLATMKKPQIVQMAQLVGVEVVGGSQAMSNSFWWGYFLLNFKMTRALAQRATMPTRPGEAEMAPRIESAWV